MPPPASSQPSGTDWEPPSVEHLHELLPQYEITEIIGRGGMGAVYKGRQTKLARDAAIKVLPETFTRQREDDLLNFAARFEQEAQAMAKLDHPAIISVFDFGETAEGQLYFVMEFIDGMDIQQYLAHHGGRLSQEQALAIIAHVLDALDYAHSRGVIHRDIKPANILLNHDGRVKIADFGLAKTLAGGGVDPASAGLTMSNVALGTPDFVAPEALDSTRSADHRADLYAVGVMLYQMLTGAIPRGHFKLPSAARPELDPRLDEIVSKSLQTDPDDRYSAASEVRAALDPIFTQPFTRVQSGDDEEQVHAVVPVAEVAEASSASPVPRGLPKPAEPPKSKAPLFIGIGGAVAAVIITLAIMFSGGGEKPDPKLAQNGPEAPGENPSGSNPPNTPEPPEEPRSGGVSPPDRPVPAPDPEKEPANPTPAPPDPPAPDPGSGTPTDPPPTPPVDPKTPEPASPESELANIPGVKTRLDGYVTARRTQVGTLATSYLRGLQARLDQTADAGDLKSATAFRAEKARVETLQKSLAEPLSADPIAALKESATLPELPEGTPDAVVTLRKTWIAERQKIRTQLDKDLQQSLKVVEAQLTKARDFEKAEQVMAFRESIQDGTFGSTVVATTPDQPDPPTTADAPGLNPFGWKPIPKDPFPLKRPERQKIPCSVVAWQVDGKAVDEAEFRRIFVGVPDDLGEVVDFECFSQFTRDPSPSNLQFPLAIAADGTVRSMKSITVLEEKSEKLKDVVKLAVGQAAGAALRADGEVIPLALNTYHSQHLGWKIESATDWKNVARLAAGIVSIVALTENGQVLGTGANQYKQLDIAPETSGRAFDIYADWGHTFMIRWNGNAFQLIGVGNRSFQKEVPSMNRILFGGGLFYGANQRGVLEWDTLMSGSHSPHSVKAIPGAIPRNVTRLDCGSAAIGGVAHGIAAACIGDDEWRFWGDLKDIAKLDTRYCERKASGCWKLFFVNQFVLGLKPVANLKPDDWTGAKPSGANSDPATATKAEPFENSLGMRFVPVPITGGPTDGKKVLFSIWETRRRDYQQFVDETKREWPKADWEMEGFVETPDHPAVMVSWEDAVAFCTWLTEKEKKSGRIGSRDSFRLPSDHEWSCAAAIGDKEDPDASPEAKSAKVKLYPWGSEWPPPKRSGNYFGLEVGLHRTRWMKEGSKEPISNYDDGFPRTAPVGSFPANTTGIFDLAGNVDEWCENTGSNSGFSRGGSWMTYWNGHALASTRQQWPLGLRGNGGIGFRCVLEVASDQSETPETTKPDLSKIFPLPIPERPRLAGRLEVYRRDGKEVGSQPDDNALADLPKDLGNNVVAISVSYEEKTTAVALLNDGTIRVWSIGVKGHPIKDPTLGLRDVVMAEAGIGRVVCLDAKGNVYGAGDGFDSFHPKKRDLPTPCVAVAANCWSAYALGTDGTVYPLVGGKDVPFDLPPAVALEAGHGGMALGLDETWRFWEHNETSVRHQMRSNGFPTEFTNWSRNLVWIDEKGKLRAAMSDGSIIDSPPLVSSLRFPVGQVAVANKFVALETTEGRWHIDGEFSTDDVRHMEKSLRGCSSVAASDIYVFGIRPVGR